MFLVLALGCLGSFSWGRKSFFERSCEVTRYRSGLAPLGTVLGIVVLGAITYEPLEDGAAVALALAAVMMLGAIALFWSSVKAFGNRRPRIAFSAGSPDALVVDGPYRFVRHPFYVAYMLFWIGGFAVAPSLLTLAAPVIMGSLYYRAAWREEQSILSSALGSAYTEYSKSSGMFLPKFASK